MSVSNATRAGVGYTVANILIRGIGFLTLPVFSRLLDTYDFGVYNVFLAYDSILFCVIGFALHSSVKSANWEFPGKIDAYASSVSLLYIGNMIILIVLALVFGPMLSEALGITTIVIIAMVLHSFGSAIVALYNARISLQYSYAKFMLVAATNSIGNIALSLLLIFTVFNGQRYLGRILGATIAFAVVGIALIAAFWHQSRPKINAEFWSFGLRYSLPIVAHGLSQVALAQIGRLMTNYMVSTVAAGIYGLAANLSTIIAVLADSVSTVWMTWFYETMEGESAEQASEQKTLSLEEFRSRSKLVRKRAGQLAMLFAIVAIILMAIAPEMIWILGGDAYVEGSYCAFGIILSGYCILLYNLIVAGEYYKQQTQYIMFGTVSAAVINIVLNYWGISQFGYIAAAYSTFVAYVFYVAFHWIISKRLMGFSILGLRVIISLAGILAGLLVVDLIYIDCIMIRLLAGVVSSAVLLCVLAKNAGGISNVIRHVIR